MSSFGYSCPYARPVQAMQEHSDAAPRVAVPSSSRRKQEQQQQQELEELATVVVFSANVLASGAQPKQEKTREIRYRSADELYEQLDRLNLLRRISAEQQCQVEAVWKTPVKKTQTTTTKRVSFAPWTKLDGSATSSFQATPSRHERYDIKSNKDYDVDSTAAVDYSDDDDDDDNHTVSTLDEMMETNIISTPRPPPSSSSSIKKNKKMRSPWKYLRCKLFGRE